MAKTVSTALAALFATRNWRTAKLFTFTLNDGTVLNYGSFDQDLTWNGTTFSCGAKTGGPYWDRVDNKAKATFGLGANVTQLTFDAVMGAGTVEGFPFATAIRYGLFDSADLQYQRAYMSTTAPTVVVGALLMFGGRVADVDFSNSVATFTCNSYLEILNINLPRNLYQPGCNNTLFDTSCTLSQSSFSSSGSVTGNATPYSFGIAGAAAGQSAGYFNLGKLQFTSGALAGPWRAIQSHALGSPPQLAVFPPFFQAPAMGDTFTAVAGCDKRQTTCAGKFNNFANFRGTPYVPPVETAV